MDLNRYDVVEAEIKNRSGCIQNKRRPYIIVSNEKSVENSPIITVMPLTHIIKKRYMPVHGCIEANSRNGLHEYSMILGEQPQTIDQRDVIKKLGTVENQDSRDTVNRVCFNSFFYGEDIDWEETLSG